MSSFENVHRCMHWTSNAAQELEEASFLTVTPNGEVFNRNGTGLTAGANAWNAEYWSISASFPLKPCWDVVDFFPEDRDVALQALLDWKGTRPIFYRDMEHTFELHGTSVEELLAEMLAAGAFEDGCGVTQVPPPPKGFSSPWNEDDGQANEVPIVVH